MNDGDFTQNCSIWHLNRGCTQIVAVVLFVFRPLMFQTVKKERASPRMCIDNIDETVKLPQVEINDSLKAAFCRACALPDARRAEIDPLSPVSPPRLAWTHSSSRRSLPRSRCRLGALEPGAFFLPSLGEKHGSPQRAGESASGKKGSKRGPVHFQNRGPRKESPSVVFTRKSGALTLTTPSREVVRGTSRS